MIKKIVSFCFSFFLSALPVAFPLAVLCAQDCIEKASPAKQVGAAHACCEVREATTPQLKLIAGCVCFFQTPQSAQGEMTPYQPISSRGTCKHPFEQVKNSAAAPQHGKLAEFAFLPDSLGSLSDICLKNAVLRI